METIVDKTRPVRKAILRELEDIPDIIPVQPEQDDPDKTKLTLKKAEFLRNFFLFVVVVLAYVVKPCHYKWAMFQMNRKRSLVLAPRDHGKSIILTVAYVIWRVIKNPNIRILIVSNSATAASKMMNGIKSHFESNKILRAIFGNYVGKQWSNEAITVSKRTQVGLREPTISVVGVYGTIVSGHFDLIIPDDLCDFENTRTKSQRDKLWNWLWMVLMPTLETNEIDPSKDGSIHFIGTRYHDDDLYGRAIGSVDKPGFLWNDTLNDGAIQYNGRTATNSEIDEMGGVQNKLTALWAERKSVKRLKQMRRDSGSIIFALQYQNNSELSKGRIFKLEDFSRKYSELPADCMLFAGTDLAVKQEETNDWFSIAVIAVSRSTKDIYLLDVMRWRISAPKQFEKIKSWYKAWEFLKVGVESVAYQEAMAQWLRENTNVPVKSVSRHTDKIMRGYKIQHLFENGKFWMPVGKQFTWFVDEMVLFPDGEFDDGFDAVETAISVAFNSNFDFAFAA